MRLTRETTNKLSNNQRKIRELLSRARRLEGLGDESDVVSFEESIKELNEGISEDEIRAWVLFKRSLGIPMKGWKKYFVKGDEEGNRLKTLRPTQIKDEKDALIMVAPSDSVLGKLCEDSNREKSYTFITQQGERRRVSKDDVKFEYVYSPKQDTLDDYVKKGILFYSSGEYLPLPVFAFGNIYERMRTLKKDEETIRKKYGEKVFSNHQKVLLDAIPEKLSFNSEYNMPELYPWSNFALETKVKKLSKACPAKVGDDGTTLTELFRVYLDTLTPSDIQIRHSAQLIKDVALNRGAKPKGEDKDKWEAIKGEISAEVMRLFKKFISEWISEDGRIELTLAWNEQFNGTGRIMSEKVPIGFSHSRLFGNNPLSLRPTQRLGVAFMELTGSGCLSFDVGVGKTLTAISTVASAMQQGKCKRPLIIVPNSTYANWIKEIEGNNYVSGVLTGCGVKVNKCYNMRQRYVPLEGDIEDGTITLATKEALGAMGFGSSFSKELREELINILFPKGEDGVSGLGDEEENSDGIKDVVKASKKEEKAKVSLIQKIEELLGKANKGSFVDFDQFGFDYIVLDEAHNYRKIFSDVKVDSNKPSFGKTPTGNPSDVAIRAFVFCNYIQRKYGDNVLLLTATPFTNAPLEVYSMLSLVGRRELQKHGLEDVHTFWETFVKEKYGEVVDAKQNIVDSWYIDSFVNVKVLQSILFTKFLYRTGDEANVPRPAKITIPLTKCKGELLSREKRVLSYLTMTSEQEFNQGLINEAMEKLASGDKEERGKGLSALGASLRNAFSPYACKLDGENLMDAPTDCEEFVEGSPKIKYVCDCIKSVKEWHEKRGDKMSGQVIYSGITGLGEGADVTYLKYIKEYLENTCGFKKGVKYEYETDKIREKKVDEVMLLTGSTDKEDKPILMDAFNDGIIKVIIGSPAIREGINLQKRATCLYILTPTWNPTDMQQLEGRIYRQGNIYQYVRIVIPLMQNSMDGFVFQKLQEKTGRVNSLWNSSERGNVLSLDSLDPEEVKLALVSDIWKIVDRQVKKEIEKAEDDLKQVNYTLLLIQDFPKFIKSYNNTKTDVISHVRNIPFNLLTYGVIPNPSKKEKGGVVVSKVVPLTEDSIIEMYNKTQATAILRVKKAYDAIRTYVEKNDFSNDLELYSNINRIYNLNALSEWTTKRPLVNDFKLMFSRITDIEKNVLKPLGYDRNSDLTSVIEKYQGMLPEKEHHLEWIKSEEHKNEVYSRIEEKKKEQDIDGGEVDERVEEFAKLNYIMKFEFMGRKENEVVPEDVPDDQIPRPKREDTSVDVKLLIRKLRTRIQKIEQM